ncbi:SWIB-domain-containing protein [Viridothelium virens]|uniref:SWIB-domain-containing protein n=1 Tax=Viridothelium virens TaxID=1048519 RepID=A0A6A6HHI1_VIRVR|nr:SWIB-domain-containing protein [Viridothelium virens]
MSLSSEAKASYTGIIDKILAAADLTTITAKTVRKGLQAKVNEDLGSLKGPINDLIIERFDKANAARTAAANAEPTPTERETNGAKSNGTSNHAGATSSSSPQKRPATEEPQDESELSEPAEDTPPPKKKNKKQRDSLDDDAAFAARLQAEENSRARPTRGGSQKKRVVAKPKKDKKSPKKKSSAKVKDDDDSDLDSGTGGEKKEKKRNGAFHKPMNLSTPLASLVGETVLSRPQTVKKIWEYVKERDLQDPNDKRQIRCDDAMRAVFKQDRVHMFTMNKILASQLYPVDED